MRSRRILSFGTFDMERCAAPVHPPPPLVECCGIPLKPKYGLNGAPTICCWYIGKSRSPVPRCCGTAYCVVVSFLMNHSWLFMASAWLRLEGRS
jgi:hypothetical protein